MKDKSKSEPTIAQRHPIFRKNEKGEEEQLCDVYPTDSPVSFPGNWGQTRWVPVEKIK